jgi:hypothetical protein
MSDQRPFRVGDAVTVHDCPIRSGEKEGSFKYGRVICIDRKNKYGLSVVVAYTTAPDSEMLETFKQDGRRYLPGDPCYITLGRKRGM